MARDLRLPWQAVRSILAVVMGVARSRMTGFFPKQLSKGVELGWEVYDLACNEA